MRRGPGVVIMELERNKAVQIENWVWQRLAKGILNPDVREMSPEPNFEIDIDSELATKIQEWVLNLKATFVEWKTSHPACCSDLFECSGEHKI